VTDELQDRIQKIDTYYSMNLKLCGAIPAIFSVFFIGSLSDSLGRRMAFFVPIVCNVLAQTISVLVIKFELALYYLYIASFLNGSGGSSFAAAVTYLSDVTNEKTRTFRLTVMEMLMFASVGISVFLINYWLKVAGNIEDTMFIPIFGFQFLAFFYVLFFLKETVNYSNAQLPSLTPVGHLKKCWRLFRLPKSASQCDVTQSLR
jgi:MFS family permease